MATLKKKATLISKKTGQDIDEITNDLAKEAEEEKSTINTG